MQIITGEEYRSLSFSFSPASHCFHLCSPQCHPQHSILQHPQPIYFP
jgi:hypothetical protein